LLFVLFYVLFVCKCVLPPGDNPIAVNKYIIYHIIYACLSEAKASHSQRIWAEVSSITPHFLHNGLSCSPER
jgi:hypothetical protein